MKTYASQQAAHHGVYLSAIPPDVCLVGHDGEALEGEANARYLRVPTALVLALSPLFGAAFVLLFPVFIVVGVAMAATAWVSEKISGFAGEHAYLARVGWEPGTAYLNRKSTASAAGCPEHADLQLTRLDAEVEARRSGHA